MPHAHDGNVLIYAPHARDARSVATVLTQQEMGVEEVTSLQALSARLGDDVGAVVMSEEALAQQDWSPLVQAANRQPSWSAYPFILMISQKKSFHETQLIYALLPVEITNVMVLERPMGSATLISAVRWALAGRRRQFVTRDHLLKLEQHTRQQRLMTRELAHRVKNTIAILQSIVTQTMNPYPETFHLQEVIVQRFTALAGAHDILIGTEFAAADFRELATKTLSVHPGNFELDGPDVRLSPQASLSFALVLHELATNSLKYGALTTRGKVALRWVIAQGDPTLLELRWSETGGPPAKKPERPGFGTRLIKTTLNGLGKVDLHYGDRGFELAFAGNLENLTHAVVPDFST